MPLIRLSEISLAYGAMPLLENANLQLDAGERVCVIGRNGAGKSSLLKIVAGETPPDSGEAWYQPGVNIGFVAQALPDADQLTVFEVVAAGLAEVGDLLTEYHQLSMQTDESLDLKRLEQVQEAIEAKHGWQLHQRVEQVIKRLDLPADKKMAELSGGWRRRVILGQALVSEPDILLLDEPTNHLDILTIEWLEQQLKQFRGAVLFITHDRSFLQSLATRIVELDRGQLTYWQGDYQSFLDHKAHLLEVEARKQAEFDKKLAQEEAWIRQGIKARRTRNEGRVRALQALREERAQRRNVQGKAKIQVDSGESSGKLVLEAKDITHGYTDKPLIKDFSLRLLRGDKIGLIGPNGVGKSTLLKLLLEQEAPQQGSIKVGTKLEVAYFDQLRDQLDLEKSVIDNIADGRETIEIGGQQKHVIGYLGDFLFTPERCRTPVKALSGGERNRLLLARLFSKPANVLVLDEPTNDLDVETLELLEELLINFTGTLLLVSHDRTFIDNVVTSTLVFEGSGVVSEYVGGYQDWLRQGGNFSALVEAASERKQAPSAKGTATSSSKEAPAKLASKKKLSYNLQRELDALPAEIDVLEAEQQALIEQTNRPDFYQQPHDQVQPVLNRLTELEQLLEAKLERWAELEAMQ
ncbi:ATP-binding cassette domain-containing protein [Endozoicomonas sp. SM1973]|uniref:ATP-binding protein Uup n=1 Tax=Spartinivicinus marinus TaxID=2994442 RepID=A0A853IF13_9GAMM|nr:ATP-binding cassette domain-containing protein [Spartinivicinus marinus]MCX4029746.1 ATP-binding cassette domain-containing protein [Spartinivicinus marinus]NYZ68077.1 ATP-binding cassette domain-containing protein [Spartinivicinus marinus]